MKKIFVLASVLALAMCSTVFAAPDNSMSLTVPSSG